MLSGTFLANTVEAIENTAEIVNEINQNAVIPEDVAGKLMYGLQVTLLGMGMVFLILILLMGFISLFKIIFYRNSVKNIAQSNIVQNKTENINIEPESNNDNEIAAVISAVIAAYYSEKSPIKSKYRIRSFKRI